MSTNSATRQVLALLLGMPTVTFAQGKFPDRPIIMVVPFPPGGSADVVARRVAQGMSDAIGQPVIVDNRAGAGGTIGASFVARSSKDGYRLMFATSSGTVISAALYKSVTYSTKSFTPIIEVTRGPFILSVQKDLSIKNVKELLAYGKAHPGKLNYGSAGAGSAHHLAMEEFKQASGLDAVHVPYKGGAPAWTALLGGAIHLMFDSAPGPLLNPGRVKPIAVSGATRLTQLPDMPTFAEQGIKGVDSGFFFGVVGPLGIPPAILDKLHTAL